MTNRRSVFIRRLAYLMAFFSLIAVSQAYAVVELEKLSTEVLQKRYQYLIDELRCPKCQNQNLAGSDSMIAQDLRREVRLMLEEGKSDQEIKDFLVARYGDFVLYRPPMSGLTLWVWVIPGVIIFFGFAGIFFVVKSAGRPLDSEPPASSDVAQSIEEHPSEAEQ